MQRKNNHLTGEIFFAQITYGEIYLYNGLLRINHQNVRAKNISPLQHTTRYAHIIVYYEKTTNRKGEKYFASTIHNTICLYNRLLRKNVQPCGRNIFRPYNIQHDMFT